MIQLSLATVGELSCGSSDILSNSSENTDEHGVAIKNVFSCATHVIGLVPLSAESGKRFDEWLNALLTVVSNVRRDALELQYRNPGQQRITIAMIKEAKDAAEHNDFGSVYRITKELVCGHKSFDGPMKDVNSGLLIHDDEHLKRGKEYFTMVLNHISSSQVPPLVNKMVNHHNMRIRTVLPNKRKIISPINALHRSKAAERDGLSAELFIVAPAVTADLVFQIMRLREGYPFGVGLGLDGYLHAPCCRKDSR